ncbi:hypothetical protein DYB26_003332 [Aphanomyces astaci]|uniref:DUF6818 domain-containing protein n=1 Tax=Aphanomyces astaci TaxID=112090 RepID=A0A397FBN1_APHAT|nr:hypothetical protein DYB31_005999 [Aphanomyces astaci]RHZ20216.1 hypothetical protein DYB26_003332 [Aphanomyces astaci]
MDKPKRQQRRYTNGERKACLNEFSATTAISGRDFCRRTNIAYSTWRDWQARRDKILASRRHSRHATLGGQGLQELIPFKDEPLAYMRDWRGSERYVRVFHLMRWVKANKMAWLVQYLSSKTSDAVAYKSFRTLLLRFSYRHRFRHRIPCKRKVSQQVLDSVWLGYAATFWDKYAQYDKSQILNVDETAIFYDMPPGKTLAEIGMSSKVSDGEKHSDRLTTVLTLSILRFTLMNARKPKTKSKDFSSEETARLLDLVEELKPFGGNMWERVAFEYNRSAHATWPERDGISLKGRFQGLNKSKPTGTAYIPPNVERAKRLYMEIESKVGAIQLHDQDDDATSERSEPSSDGHEEAASLVDELVVSSRIGTEAAELVAVVKTEKTKPVMYMAAQRRTSLDMSIGSKLINVVARMSSADKSRWIAKSVSEKLASGSSSMKRS